MLDEATEFLRELLADGPVPAREVMKAYDQAGLSRTTVFRAKHILGVKVQKRGGSWYWLPPEQADQKTDDDEGAVVL